MLDKNYRCRRGDARAVRTFTQIGGSFRLAVGLIALRGVAVEMGVFMFLYRDPLFYEMRARGLKKTQEHLHDAIVKGIVMRLRRMFMTVAVDFVGLVACKDDDWHRL